MMEREHHAVQVLRELLRVRVGPELPRLDRLPDRRGDDVQPLALQLDQPVARGSGAVVQLTRRRHEDAPTRQRLRLLPLEPPLEQRAHPRLAARLLEGRAHDGLHEARRRVLEHLDLQRLL